MPSRAVGLIVFTEFDGQTVAVCHRRGAFDFEENKPETWKGLLQVTCHGKLREGEEYADALVREESDEIGMIFRRDQLSLLVDGVVQTYCVKCAISVVAGFRLHASSGGIVLITRSAVDGIQVAPKEYRESGVPDGSLAMFSDELASLRLGFERFS